MKILKRYIFRMLGKTLYSRVSFASFSLKKMKRIHSYKKLGIFNFLRKLIMLSHDSILIILNLFTISTIHFPGINKKFSGLY